MLISPGDRRNYKEFLNYAIKSYNDDDLQGNKLNYVYLDDFIEKNCKYYRSYKKDDMKEYQKIIDCCIAILSLQYNDPKVELEINMRKFYKCIIYDFVDLRNALTHFISIQIQSIVRSIIEHTRMFILCLYDCDFKQYYFSDYTTYEEKKKRYYKKRGKNIDEKLKGLANIENTKQSQYYIKALDSESLYKRIHQEFSELSHLNEFTIANQMYSENLELNFGQELGWRYNKYFDDILEYLVSTVLIASRNINESHEIDACYFDYYVFYNFLATVHNTLMTFRASDEVLRGLKEAIKAIWKPNE